MTLLKVALALGLLIVMLLFFGFGGSDYLTFDAIKSAQQSLQALVTDAPVLSFFGFALIYIVVAALSLPGAAVLTLLAGGLFGLWQGLVLVSFAASIGATLAMLAARFLFRDLIASKFSEAMTVVNQGMKADGARYLLTLRLVPAVPFFVINLVMGLTGITARRFYWVSQLGMLPGTLIYVNAGKQLADLQSPAGILSPELLVSFVLLALLPWLMKAMTSRFEQWQRYRPFRKPKRFDRDLIVIGAGSGGLVAALIGSLVEAKVTLIEANEMGGDCLNTGCVPSKAFIRSASLAAEMGKGEAFGVTGAAVKIDFPVIMKRVQAVIDSIKPNDSPERYREFGVDVRQGKGILRSPYEVEVDGERLTARSIIIASGAAPFMPKIEGLDPSRCYTSETIWQLEELPKRLAVIGGGPIGLELAQSFARLGSEVTVVEMMPRIMIKEDVEVSDLMAGVLTGEGVQLLVNNRLASATSAESLTLRVAKVGDADQFTAVECDVVLFAAGRKPRVEGFGLEALNIGLTENGQIQVNDYLQTNYPNIFAVGDVAGRYQFTHTASHMAWYASVNALFGTFKKFKVDYRVIPWCTFTSPEVARVGLSESEAEAKGIAFECARFEVAELDRAKTEGLPTGFVKVLTKPGSDQILGVTIVSAHAGESIAEFVLAMKYGLGLKKIMGTIHIYPTWAEMNKFVSGVWQKAHKPNWALPWLARYHRFRRGG